LVELLRAADPARHGFSKVIVWSGRSTLEQIEERPWLFKGHESVLDGNLLLRSFWQRFSLARLAHAANCDVLFAPGGSYMGDFRPIVTMSRNLLPFDWRELRRYGWSWMALKQSLLRITQAWTFRRADGVIFLTGYARDVVTRAVRPRGSTTIIPHGIDGRFFTQPREQLAIREFSADRPFRIIYVSTIEVYKHQWRVAEAIAQLRASGFPVALTLVGPAYPPALKRLRATLARLNLTDKIVRYSGAVSYQGLHKLYVEQDLCVFASSCENMPNILLEGMAAGLPIASSDRGPMPEVLGDAGVYFDPEDARDIARALSELIESPVLRAKKAEASFARAQNYSWRRCAAETFAFLADTALAKSI
jgi:glycosyltransferase involved in cell wall biosynthesis